MYRLSEPSAPLVVFLIVMTGGGGILSSILVLAVLLLCVLGSSVHSMHWRGFALVGVSLSFIVLGFEMMVRSDRRVYQKLVAKCSTDCFIRLQVSWWQYNTGKCDALESSQYRQGCRTVIQLPPSQVTAAGPVTEFMVDSSFREIAQGARSLESSRKSSNWCDRSNGVSFL